MNPIQQLVDAAKLAADEANCCDEPHDADCPIYKLRTARAAVESAQVETRWHVQYHWSEVGWVSFADFTTQQQAIDRAAVAEQEAKSRIVRIDTYRSVESDQK